MIHVIVRERDAAAQATEPITSGSVGLECSFRFSEDWDGLGKVAIFQGSGQIIDVALVGQESCAVPHEVLQQALGHLKIGVYGTGEQGQRVTPTIWADAGRILPGVEPSEIEPTPATQSLVQQILEAAENAEEIAQGVRDDADAGEFDGDPGEKGDPGDDGFSPEVSVTTITGGHRVTITDADGTNVFDVMDGEKGDPGEDAEVTYYSAAVASGGTLTMPADMPTPTEIKASVGSGASLPLLRIYDRSWTNGSDQVLEHRNYYYELRYAERPALAPIFAKFNNVIKVPSSGELIFVEVEGVEENGSTTWTISKEALGGGSSVAPAKTWTVEWAQDGPIQPSASADFDATVAVTDITDADESNLPKTGDFLIGPEPGHTPDEDVTYLYTVYGTNNAKTNVRLTVITELASGGTSDYAALTNKPQIGGVELSGNKTAAQLSLATASDVAAKYTKPSGGIPASDIASGVIPSTASEVGAIAAPASPTSGDVLTYDGSAWGASAPSHQIPSGGNAGECLAKNSASNYDLRWRTINDWTPAGLMRTSGGTAAKVAEWSFWAATQYPAWLVVTVGNSNTYAGAITLKVNGSTAYPIYINGEASSATNYTLPAGSYFVYFDGSKFDFRTDGKIPGDITGHAGQDIAAPASPSTGDFLCWNGSAWAATTLAAWQGGNY